jgi:ABC-type multidrug transport system ATPase subunit
MDKNNKENYVLITERDESLPRERKYFSSVSKLENQVPILLPKQPHHLIFQELTVTVVIRPQIPSDNSNANKNDTNNANNTNINTDEKAASLLKTRSKEIAMIKYGILKKVSGEVESNQILFIVGPNENGLSALLRVLRGEIRDNEEVRGHIFLDNKEITLGTPLNCLYINEETENAFVSAKTMREELSDCLSRARHIVPEPLHLTAMNMILDKFDLRRYCDVSLSKSHETIPLLYRRRFILAKSLLEAPADIILLDGQLRNLDVHSEVLYFDTLRMLADRGYLILCTHTQPTMEAFDRIDTLLILRENGKLAFFGTTKDSFAHFNFRPSTRHLLSLSHYLKEVVSEIVVFFILAAVITFATIMYFIVKH